VAEVIVASFVKRNPYGDTYYRCLRKTKEGLKATEY